MNLSNDNKITIEMPGGFTCIEPSNIPKLYRDSKIYLAVHIVALIISLPFCIAIALRDDYFISLMIPVGILLLTVFAYFQFTSIKESYEKFLNNDL